MAIDSTGDVILRHLRGSRRTRSLPVVIVSAYPRVLPAVNDALVTAILPKPVNVDTLLHAVRRALEPSPKVIRPDTSITLTSPTCRVLNFTLTSHTSLA